MKKTIRRAIKCLVITCYHVMRLLFSIQKRKIVISSNLGKSYSGNPKSIYKYMVRKGLDREYTIIWFYEKQPYDISGHHQQVRYGRWRYLYHMATAGIWIFDARQPEFLRKSQKVCYIQTWHGTPLKKLALDMDAVFMEGESSLASYKESFRKNAATWDYLISQNDFSSHIFVRAFDFHGTLLPIGYPRNDILFHENTQEKVIARKKQLELPLNKKIILYAPTWRDDEAYRQGEYRFEPKLDFERLKNELSDEYVMIVKYHYLIMDTIDWTPYQGFIYAFDQTWDIAELYLAADLLITDYSSVMFDYSLLHRPILFYAYDLERYKNELRGFYFDLEEEAPGPILRTTEELVRYLQNPKPEAYQEQYEKFCRKYNHLDHGDACEQVVQVIQNHT